MRARVNSRPQKKRGMSQTQRLWCTKNKVWRLWVPFFSFSVSYSIFESLNSCILIFFLFVSSPQKHFSFRERQPLFARDSNLLLLLLLFLRVLPKTTPDEKDENAALPFFLRRRRRRREEQQPSSCRRGRTNAEENRRKSSSTRMNSRLEWNASSSEIISRTFRE